MPEILDPPEKLVRPGVPLDQLAHQAEWAETFRPTNNSFASRFRKPRYESDIREYGEALQARKSAAIEAQARINAQAQGFYFKSRELDAKARIDQIKLGQAHELHEKKLKLMERQTSVAGERERALIAKTDLLLDDTEQEERETAGFTAEIKNSGTTIGTRARAEAVAKAWEKHPGVEPTTFEQAWKMTRADKTPAEILAEVKAAREGLPTATVTGRAPGLTITDRPVKAAPDVVANKIAGWKEKRAKAAQDREPKMVAFFDEQIADAEREAAATAVPSVITTPSTPSIERTATNPQTGEKVVFRNGQWQPLTR